MASTSPIAQIAQALSLSETAVKSRLHRARAFVRVRLGVAGQPEGAARAAGAHTPGRNARTLGAPGPT